MEITTINSALGMAGSPAVPTEPVQPTPEPQREPEKPPVEVINKAEYQGQQVDTSV